MPLGASLSEVTFRIWLLSGAFLWPLVALEVPTLSLFFWLGYLVLALASTLPRTLSFQLQCYVALSRKPSLSLQQALLCFRTSHAVSICVSSYLRMMCVQCRSWHAIVHVCSEDNLHVSICPSTKWVLGIDFKVIILAAKCLYRLSHLPGPQPDLYRETCALTLNVHNSPCGVIGKSLKRMLEPHLLLQS